MLNGWKTGLKVSVLKSHTNWCNVTYMNKQVGISFVNAQQRKDGHNQPGRNPDRVTIHLWTTNAVFWKQ